MKNRVFFVILAQSPLIIAFLVISYCFRKFPVTKKIKLFRNPVLVLKKSILVKFSLFLKWVSMSQLVLRATQELGNV